MHRYSPVHVVGQFVKSGALAVEWADFFIDDKNQLQGSFQDLLESEREENQT